MATIVHTSTDINRDVTGAAVTWSTITSANAVGDLFEWPKYSDRSIQVSGTWDSATAILQGSNDGTTFFTLHDPLGNNISFTADGLKQVLEVTRYVRPSTSGGGGSQSLKAVLVCVARVK